MKNEGRILALDYGSRRVGAALSDPLGVIAQGAGVLPNDAQLLVRLQAMVTEHQVCLIVVGMPYAPDGGLGRKGEEVQAFMASLATCVSVPIESWDESQSTVSALRALIDGGMRRNRRRQKGTLDEMAARMVLQEYLDHHR